MSNTRKFWLASDWFKCHYQFLTRLACCFLLDYWLSMQALSFLLTTLVLGCNWIHKWLPNPRVEEQMTAFHRVCAENEEFKTYIR